MDAAVKKRLKQCGFVVLVVALAVAGVFVVVDFINDPGGTLRDLASALRNMN